MLFAVHISDGVLTLPWVVGGWVVAALLVTLAAWKVHERDIPRLGVLTAAFFVASQVHLRVGPTSVHLLLNGLVGVVAGRRVGLVTSVGLALQALLFSHGGVATLGVNVAVYTLPALVAALACPPLRRSGVIRIVPVRCALVFLFAVLWLGLATVALQRGLSTLFPERVPRPSDFADWWLAHPMTVAAVVCCAVGAAWLERRLESDPEFAIGLLLGAGTALATVGLNALVLSLGGDDAVKNLAEVVFLANLPVVIVESVAVGFVVAYLAKAKPEWVGGAVHAPGSGKISSNGTSH
jgi:ABC-type Co2+ transport system permease subunit